MSRNAIIGLMALVFSGAGLVGFAQMPGTSPPLAPAGQRGEPSHMPLNFGARPLGSEGSALRSDGAIMSLADSPDNPTRPIATEPAPVPRSEQSLTANERSVGNMKVTEFSRVASEYATVAAAGDVIADDTTPQATVGPVPSVPLGGFRRVPATPSPAPADAPSILKRPEIDSPEHAALNSPPALVEPSAAPALSELSNEDADSNSDARVSARRMPRTPSYSDVVPAPASQAPSIRDMSYRSVAPHLRLETRGPQALNLGKESRYYLDLFNEGEADAPEVQVRMVLPASVKVQQLGEGASLHPDPAGQRVMWVVPSVEARGRTTLELRLIATEAKGFEMGVDWAFRPTGFKAAVAVRQPQLQVAVTGPGEMAFGEEKSFRVTVSNVGTGDAENVIVQTGATGNREQKLDVGLLAAGAQKEFTVTFIANQPGEMAVKTFAVGDADLQAESASTVLIRRAELVAAMTAPALKYSGSQAIFAVAVGNAGNTPANDVQLSMTLPVGATYVSGIEGATVAGNSIKWKAEPLPAGPARLFSSTLELHTAGENKVEVQARGTGAGVAVATQAATMVEALADLKLVVNDQPGPFPAGSEVTYELQIINRGSNVAKNLKVLMHFSEGIEPIAVEGAEARMVPGQVLCEPFAQIGAGEQISLKVKAKGETAGNHLYRIEVLCAEPETRLVSEGTTRFIPDNASTRLSTRPSLFNQK